MDEVRDKYKSNACCTRFKINFVLKEFISNNYLQHSIFTFYLGPEDCENTQFVGIIVLAIMLAITLVSNAYFIYQNRRLKSLKATSENNSNERNDSKDIYENPVKDEENYEKVENEQSSYTALKKPGERDDDDHLYCHLDEVQKENPNQRETGI